MFKYYQITCLTLRYLAISTTICMGRSKEFLGLHVWYCTLQWRQYCYNAPSPPPPCDQGILCDLNSGGKVTSIQVTKNATKEAVKEGSKGASIQVTLVQLHGCAKEGCKTAGSQFTNSTTK